MQTMEIAFTCFISAKILGLKSGNSLKMRKVSPSMRLQAAFVGFHLEYFLYRDPIIYFCYQFELLRYCFVKIYTEIYVHLIFVYN